jgi:GTPase
MGRKPLVALVGRPNVGKSTLFNKIIGERRAIVQDEPGTTRDRNYGESDWLGRDFLIVDTGGLLVRDEDHFAPRIRQQALAAMEEADVIVMVVDAREGLTAADRDVADLLRQTQTPVILAANKAESEERRLNSVEFYEASATCWTRSWPRCRRRRAWRTRKTTRSRSPSWGGPTWANPASSTRCCARSG